MTRRTLLASASGMLLGSVAAAQARQVVIRFVDQVNERSVSQLLGIIDAELAQGTTRFTILISSPGGSVFWGLTAHNYLKGIPAEVITHNMGSSDSIAVMMYCAGSRRLAVPNSRFVLHGIGLTLPGGTRYEERKLQEQISSMQTDTGNIARIIAEVTKRSESDVAKAIFDGTVLNATEAKDWGLVQEITTELFPTGSRIISITPPLSGKSDDPESNAEQSALATSSRPDSVTSEFVNLTSLPETTPDQ